MNRLRFRTLIFCTLSLATLYFASCRPRGILHSWEMREVLVDLHKTDAVIQMNGLQHGHDEARSAYYAQTLAKHGITQAQFDSSLVWYTAHPQLFDKIYPKVLADLKAEEEAFLAAHEEELKAGPRISKNTPEETEERAFSRTDLDSILWVTAHSYCTDWTPFQRPFRMIDHLIEENE